MKARRDVAGRSRRVACPEASCATCIAELLVDSQVDASLIKVDEIPSRERQQETERALSQKIPSIALFDLRLLG
jgi:hypothetical protein